MFLIMRLPLCQLLICVLVWEWSITCILSTQENKTVEIKFLFEQVRCCCRGISTTTNWWKYNYFSRIYLTITQYNNTITKCMYHNAFISFVVLSNSALVLQDLNTLLKETISNIRMPQLFFVIKRANWKIKRK